MIRSSRFLKTDWLWAAVAIIGLFFYTLPSIPHYIEIAGLILSLALVAYAAYSEDQRIFYLARIGLFCMVAAYAYGVKLADESLFFSVFEFSTQRLEIVRKMFGLTMIGAPFCWMGLRYGDSVAEKNRHNLSFQLDCKLYYVLVFVAGAALVGISAYLILNYAKGTIFTGAYGGGQENVQLPIGAMNVISGIGMAVMLYGCVQLKRAHWYFIFVAATASFLFSCQILRGLRQDAASALFMLTIVYFVLRYGNFKFRISYLYTIVPLLAFFELFGLVRSGISQWAKGYIGFSEVLDIGLGNGIYSDVVYSGTLGPISTTFANSVQGMVFENYKIVWGQGYLEYFARLVPEFLNSNRPTDYTFFFKDKFISGGGIFEVAEALINFGWLGAIIMPFLISFCLAFLYKKFELNRTFITVVLFSSFASVFLRGAWYQTFAYVKAVEIGVLLSLAYITSFLIFNSVRKALK